jgi:TetR/AcrR family transcriptional repressor of nem operon
MNVSKKSPGRPRAFDQQAALTAAMRLFWRGGYAATSVPEISSATGLSTSSLYNTYGSKLDLLVASLRHYHDTVLDGFMLGPMLRGTEGLADLDRFLDRLAKAARATPARGCLAVNTIAEFRNPPPAVAEQTGRYRAMLRAALGAALRRAADIGEIPPDTVGRRVNTLVPMVLAYNLLVASGTPGAESLDLLRTAHAVAQD